MKDEIIKAIRTVHDPELPINIYDLGLIYDIEVNGSDVHVQMTLTSPACPVAGSLPGEVEVKIKELDGVDNVEVELVWEPTWSPDLMSDDARMALEMTGVALPPIHPKLIDIAFDIDRRSKKVE